MKYLLSLVLIVFSISTHAVRYAYVKKPKAIVYADKELNVPIGYISIGKKVKVSDKTFKRGKIVPLIVTGKVAYIETENLTFKYGQSVYQGAPVLKEHNIDIILQSDEDKLSQNNFFTLGIGQLGAGSDLDNLASETQSETFSLVTISPRIEHRSPKKNYGFGIILNYVSGSSSELAFTTLLIEGEYQRRLFQTTLLSIEAYGGLGFSGDAQLKVASTGEQIKGVIYGYSFGARLRIFPFSKLGVWGSMGYSQYNLSSFEAASINNQQEAFFVKTVGGFKAELALSYKF